MSAASASIRLLLVTSFLGAAPVAWAQAPAPPSPSVAPAGPGAHGGRIREQIRARVRALTAEKLTQVLNLDPATAGRLFAVADRWDDAIAGVRRDNARLRRELGPMLRAGLGDDATINRYVDQLLANKARIEQLEVQRNQELRRVLPPAQFARLIVALPVIKMQIRRDMLSAIRPRAAQGPGPAAFAPDDDPDEE